MRNQVIIIGGGASGMVAAITAARQGAKVTVIEQKNELGKKILATGNGRCNFTNLSIDTSHYYCEDVAFIQGLINTYSPSVIMKFFEELGVLSKDRNGYVYPFTDQASTIRNALVSELESLHVKVLVDTVAEQISYHNDTRNALYSIRTNQGTYQCDMLIIATGGKSGLGKNTVVDGFTILQQTKHQSTLLSPALVPLKGQGKFYKKIAGIRTDVAVTAIIDSKQMRTEVGEIQLTDYGISGIPVFQISRILTQELCNKKHPELKVEIDFLPDFSQEELEEFFINRKEQFSQKTVQQFMNGILKDKLADFMLYTARIDGNRKLEDVTIDELYKLTRICKTFAVKIEDSKEFMQSQVTAGGIPLNQVSDTLESNYYKQMYFTGEVLDVDGICGGYNLHFAWATGMLVGEQYKNIRSKHD